MKNWPREEWIPMKRKSLCKFLLQEHTKYEISGKEEGQCHE